MTLPLHLVWSVLRSRLLLFVPVFLMTVSSVVAQVASSNVSQIEFWLLSESERKSTLVSALVERQKVLRENVEYLAETSFANHQFADGQIGEVVDGSSMFTRSHYWQMDKSYRMEIKRDPLGLSGRPNEHIITALSADSGVVRSIGHLRGVPKQFARIDTNEETIVESDRYRYWLDGEHSPKAEFLLRCITDRASDLHLEKGSSDETVVVTAPWRPIYKRTDVGTRTFTLDIAKGFMPVSGRAEWREGEKWRTEEFTVRDFIHSDDFWMPIDITEVITASPGGPSLAAVYRTKVHLVRFGAVTEKDLKLEFPSGAEVVDATRGVFYSVGENDEPIGPVKSLLGGPPIGISPRETR